VVIGVIALLVPILPTTPFLLLAAFFYARSSEKFLHWLLYNRWCGEHLRNYREGRGMLLRTKILTVGTLWISISVSAFVFVKQLWIRLLLFFIAALVSLHIILIKTYKPTTPKPGTGNDTPAGKASPQ
jgi:uncharacterized membrane protein YbaN (DUF454 family)